MKILAVDQKTKKPYANSKIQLQVRGKDSGYLSFTTDAAGSFTLDDKYKGQQIASTTGGTGSQAITASEGATLYVAATTGTTQKTGTQGKTTSTPTK